MARRGRRQGRIETARIVTSEGKGSRGWGQLRRSIPDALFNTLVFAVFFALVWSVWWLLPPRLRRVWMLRASLLFYGGWDWRFLGLFLLTGGINYAVALGEVVIADNLAPLVERAFDQPDPSAVTALLGAYAFTWQVSFLSFPF